MQPPLKSQQYGLSDSITISGLFKSDADLRCNATVSNELETYPRNFLKKQINTHVSYF